MKRQIRHSVFETNSSSTHSLTMCSKEDFDKWVDGKLMFDTYNDSLVEVVFEISEKDKEFAREYYESKKNNFWKEWNSLSEDEVNEWYKKYMNDYGKFDYNRYNTYGDFIDGELETFFETYTTKNGEKIIAFGRYGYEY